MKNLMGKIKKIYFAHKYIYIKLNYILFRILKAFFNAQNSPAWCFDTIFAV